MLPEDVGVLGGQGRELRRVGLQTGRRGGVGRRQVDGAQKKLSTICQAGTIFGQGG